MSRSEAMVLRQGVENTLVEFFVYRGSRGLGKTGEVHQIVDRKPTREDKIAFLPVTINQR